MIDFTTPELQRAARAFLRRYLDVRGGTVPAQALTAFLAPAARNDLARLGAPTREGMLQHSEMGPVRVLRLGGNRACAVVGVAAPDDTTHVLAVELEVREGRLAATRLGEIGGPQEQERRKDRLPIGPEQPVPEAPAHLTGLLGDLPAAKDARDRWVAGAAVIDTYRERYSIDDGAAFGAIPDDPEQQRERTRALTYVREMSRQVEALAPHKTTEREPGHEPLDHA